MGRCAKLCMNAGLCALCVMIVAYIDVQRGIALRYNDK